LKNHIRMHENTSHSRTSISIMKNSMFKFQNSKLSLLITILVIIGVSCGDSNENDTQPRPTGIEIRPDVVFVTTDSEPVYRWLESTGVVEPNRDLALQSRVGGQVAWHRINEGRLVQAGDTLLRLVDEEWQLRFMEAENTWLRASQEYRIEKELRGRDARGDQDGLSEQDDRMLRQQTGLLQAEIQMERARLDLSYTVVTAPYTGVIHTTLNLSQGAFISAGMELGRLLDHGSIRIRLDVLESELTGLRQGMSVQMTSPQGETATGRIQTLSPVVNRDRKTGQIVVEAGNERGLLKTGMTVQGRILTETFNGRVRAPRSVLLERDGRRLIFRLRGDMVEWIYVDPAVITPEYILLNEDALSPGDTLAYDRHFALSHQQRVNVRLKQ
jgi:membrane fusion protein, multidrug efflux system